MWTLHVCDTVRTVLVVTRGPWIWVYVIMVKDTQTRIVWLSCQLYIVFYSHFDIIYVDSVIYFFLTLHTFFRWTWPLWLFVDTETANLFEFIANLWLFYYKIYLVLITTLHSDNWLSFSELYTESFLISEKTLHTFTYCSTNKVLFSVQIQSTFFVFCISQKHKRLMHVWKMD